MRRLRLWWFDSTPPHQMLTVAQLVELQIVVLVVVSSILIRQPIKERVSKTKIVLYVIITSIILGAIVGKILAIIYI